jgi:protein-L-isoaspartate(D-aspartate) O-methyltransferase
MERRGEMVERDIVRRGIRDERVLAAMRKVPRERFVSVELDVRAYEDGPLPIGHGQTISQPYIVALMAEALALTSGDRVLEIGTGSGYAAAVMSELVAQVYSVERHEPLARAAELRFQALGYRNIAVRLGDGTLGWPEAAPFSAISVAAGGAHVPRPLLDQLALGGRLVIPIGETPERQELLRVTRHGPHDYRRESLGSVVFVPLVGAEATKQDH